MKRKLKLAFDQLERELSLIPQMELAQILGGTSSGSSGSGVLANDASIDEVVDYLQDKGFPLTEDSSGNYYFSSSSGVIMLDEVEIFGSYSTGSSGYFYGSSGTLDSVINYFTNYGYSFTSDGYGGYNYNPSIPSDPNTPPEDDFRYDNDDSWETDSEGNIIKIPTGRPDVTTYSTKDGVTETLTMKEVTITTIDGTEITAYEVIGVTDAQGNSIAIQERHRSNCTGLAFTNGEVWIMDSDNPGDESASFESVLANTNKYQVVTKDQADFVIIRDTHITSGETHIVHSGYLDSNQEYRHKSNGNVAIISTTEADFKGNHFQPPTSNFSSQLTYYKRLY